MLKPQERLSDLASTTREALRQAFSETREIGEMKISPAPKGSVADLVAQFELGGHPRTIVCVVTDSGQPRHVRSAIYRLRFARDHFGLAATMALVAPYLSAEARALCREHGVDFVDLQGNCRIRLEGAFIERTSPTRPPVIRRTIKSMFTPKAARVLRLMLRAPDRTWKVLDLSREAGVSLGHVSNVRAALLTRKWATAPPDGLRLADPGSLLESWRASYGELPGTKHRFYTPLDPRQADKAARGALNNAGPARAILASFSAARLLAPLEPAVSQLFYADEGGLEQLRAVLRLSPAGEEENVLVRLLADDDLFLDAVESEPGVFTTSPVQTFLDLSTAGERGENAAAHLRLAKLKWPV